MNRLLCGDSGNGKTEVTIRAIVQCVSSGYQAIVLVPTTVLAEQHYQTFSTRMQELPITVATYTRNSAEATRSSISAGIAEGKIDILITTHRILYDRLSFHKLGLLIIDEEHRFGVRAKEKIKSAHLHIDYLAISATPIPRSLQFALSQLYDISFLDSAPEERKSIITKMYHHSDEKIDEAIRFELTRGGQIYYLHNNIATIPAKMNIIKRRHPNIRCRYIHSKLNSKEINQCMRAFVNGEYDLLLSTTIIENGIDISNVNTIIIENADNFGMSNLYQLRGRVGRAHRQAYAYLFYNADRGTDTTAQRRLKVIGDEQQYYSGISIALQDLKIRGAGNILGKQQSGDICAVGYELYVNMLNKSVEQIRNSEKPIDHEPYLELEYEGYIPDDYVSSVAEKLELYRSIAFLRSRADIRALTTQMIDRYGAPPPEVVVLLRVSDIRIASARLWITHIKQRQCEFRLYVHKIARLHQGTLLSLIEKKRARLMVNGRFNLCIEAPNEEQEEQYTWVRNILYRLQ